MNKLILSVIAGAAAGFFICKIKNKARMLKTYANTESLEHKTKKAQPI